jgi:hypothetical protein
MTPKGSQYIRGHEIPERHWMYRLAKHFWFNDFGVYEKAGDPDQDLLREVQVVSSREKITQHTH